MKNKILLAILAIALVFAIISCSNGSTSNTPQTQIPTEDPAVYECEDESGSYYKLVITAPVASGRAAHNPQKDDNYVLTIKSATGPSESSGKVNSKNGSDLVLQPGKTGAPPFTVKTESGLMTAITGTITITSGSPVSTPSNITPLKSYDNLELFAGRYYEDDDETKTQVGEAWAPKPSIMKLSDFTSRKPEKIGQKFYFKVSGTTDATIKRLRIHIHYHTKDDWSDYDQIGYSGFFEVKTTGDFENTFVVEITNGNNGLPADPSFVPYEIGIENFLWWVNDNGTVSGSKDDSIPTNIKTGARMATIKNFRISLTKVE
jgi:hypothetical protein